MASLLLDTTVLIDVLRGRQAVSRLRELRAAGDRPCACAINVEEIYRGIRGQEAEAVQRLCSGLWMVPLGEYEGRIAGVWRREFARQGVTLAQADCLIAAAAVAAGGRLATGNPADFPMEGLQVEHWPVG